jgi:hypothetical protein
VIPSPDKKRPTSISHLKRRSHQPNVAKKHYLNFKGVTHNTRIPVKKGEKHNDVLKSLAPVPNIDINQIMTESDEYMICKTDRLTSIYTSRKGSKSSIKDNSPPAKSKSKFSAPVCKVGFFCREKVLNEFSLNQVPVACKVTHGEVNKLKKALRVQGRQALISKI